MVRTFTSEYIKKKVCYSESREITEFFTYLKQIVDGWTVFHRLNFDVILCDEFVLLALDEKQ